MAFLGMIKNVCNEVGVAEPDSVIGSSDQQVKQLIAIANTEGRLLAHRHPKGWNKLIKEVSFTAVGTQSQGVLTTISGSDFDFIVNDTIWNQTTQDRLDGPLSPAFWQMNQAVVTTSPYPDYRIRGGELLLATAPTAGNTLAWEYVSKNWCQSSASVGQAAWAADTDTGILDEDLMTLGVIWRWLHRNGLDYEEDFNTYEREVSSAVGRDGGKRRHWLDPPSGLHAHRIRVPEGSWLQ
jgi:hypothetical protein